MPNLLCLLGQMRIFFAERKNLLLGFLGNAAGFDGKDS
jgi:hypothetical protein